MTRPKADRRPTWTALVLDALTRADDFMDMPMLVAATKGSPSQVSAALFHLTKRHVVQPVEGAGRLWWFATPGDDDRMRTVDARVPEPVGNRTRGRRAAKMWPTCPTCGAGGNCEHR